ncbi:two-partner secretion domain-containing protein [Pseudomonas lini]
METAQAKSSRSSSKKFCNNVHQRPRDLHFNKLVMELSIALLALGVPTPFGWAGPQGGQVVSGLANISQSGLTTTIQQQTQRAVVNWQQFGVKPNEVVRFQQPGLTAAILNRVTGALPTHIEGLVQGNGRVFLVNPNGIVIGTNGVVNVQGGFVASTQSLSDAAFMQGGELTLSGDSDGKIQILGKISTPSGDVTIIAPKIEVGVDATLEAGRAIQLVAANSVMLSNGHFKVIPRADDAGELNVQGVMSAAIAQLAASNNNLGALAINTSGTIRATGTQVNPDGSISIVATGAGGNVQLGGSLRAINSSADGGAIALSGENVTLSRASIDASGTRGGKVSVVSDTGHGTTLIGDSTLSARGTSGAGGKIAATGRNLGLTGATRIDASGTAGGGEVLVGGGFHGTDERIANATATSIGADVVLAANGTQGDAKGGEVVVWSNDTTRFAGTVRATGSGAGNGGDAEVSGAGTLDYRGFADLAGGSNSGGFGSLLLDPTDVIIQNAGADSGVTWASGAADFSSSGGSSIITVGTLQTQLASANVTVDSHGGTGGNGDITVNDAVIIPDARSLTLKAAGDIYLNADVTTASTGTLTSFNAYANRDININAANLGGTAGLSSVTLISGLGTYGSASQDTPSLTTFSSWLPSYAGQVNFLNPVGTTLSATQESIVITGCSTACPQVAADSALTLPNSGATSPDLTINGAAAAGNVALGGSGAIYFAGFRDISVDGALTSTASGSIQPNFGSHSVYRNGVSLYALRDLTVNAPISSAAPVQLKSERDITFNADVVSGAALSADAARDIYVNTTNLSGAYGAGGGTPLPTGLYLLAGQRATTQAEYSAAVLAYGSGLSGAVTNNTVGVSASNLHGAVYFQNASGATHLRSNANTLVVSGCTTIVACLPSGRTDFLPANVLLESSAGTGPALGSISIGGFRNITPERWDPATGTIASSLTAGGNQAYYALGNLTINQTALGAGGSLYLYAAGGNPSDPTPASGATLADYAGIVYFTQPTIELSATGTIDIRSGTDGTGTALGAAGGTLPGGGAYSGGRTNQARPYFNDPTNPNHIIIRYGSAANALSGSLVIQGFLDTVLTLQNNDGTAASALTTNGINISSYGDVVIPQHYIRALGGGTLSLVAGGGTAQLVGQVRLTDASPVLQAGFGLNLYSNYDSTGHRLDFNGGNGTLTGGYGTGGPILLQYDPGWDHWTLMNINGFRNTDLYVFAGTATPTLATFDPNVAFSVGTYGQYPSNITSAGNVTIENNRVVGQGGGASGYPYNSTNLHLTAGATFSNSLDSNGILRFALPTTISGGFQQLTLVSDASGLASPTAAPDGNDLTNVTFGPIGVMQTTPVTASIDGTTTTLDAPVTPRVASLIIDGFRNVDLNTTNGAPLYVGNLHILPQGNSKQGDITINADVYVGNQVYITGSSINTTGNHVIGSLAQANASYDPRFTATGRATAWGGTAKDSTINTSSKNNNKSSGMQISNVAAGTTMTINERDTVIISNFGASTDQGNIVVNAQGDIGVNGSIVRTGASNPASITLNADKDLSSIFTGYDAYDQGTVSAQVQAKNVAGGDGVGVTYFLAPVERVVPIYTPVGVLSLQSTNPLGTDYVAPTDPGWNAARTQYTISSSSPAGLRRYFAIGAIVTPGQVVVSSLLNVNNQQYLKWVGSSGGQVYVVTGYTTSTAAQAQFTSLGFGVNTLSGTVSNGATGSTITTTLNRTSYGVSGDNPVVDSLVTPTGNPVADTYALGLGEQFYVAAGGSAIYPDASWNVRVTGPVTVQTQLGDIVVKSGSTYADTYQGFHTAGDTADVRLSSNVPTSGQGLGHPENMQQNLVTRTVDGNVLIGGYRDIMVLDANTVQPTGTGTISLIAGRDLLLQDDIGVANQGTLTLGAGNMIEQTAGKIIAADNLVLLTGRGSNNLQTSVNNLAGYLQMPDADYTGALAGGTTATGTLQVTNDKTLNVVSTIAANEVAGAVTFTTSGPVFDDTTPLQVAGLTTSTLGGAIAGSIELTATAGDINLSAPVTTTTTGGEINIKASAGNVALGTDVTTTGNAFIQAGQAITRSAGTLSAAGAVLTAGTTIGSAASPVQTDVNTLALVAGGNVFVQNEGALTAAGQTTNNGSLSVTASGDTLTVGAVNLQPTILNNAPGANLSGMIANGSGAVTLSATGSASDVVFDASARSGTGTVTVSAGQNILDNLPALVSGAESSASTSLAVATGGNVILDAGNTIGGGDGVAVREPLGVWSGSGTISATAAGTDPASGIYLDLLDTTGAVTLGGAGVSLTSGKNIDVTAVASTTANTGNLVVAGAVAGQNDGYVRLAADQDVTVGGAVSTTGAGNIVLTAGLNGSGSVTQTAGGTLTTGSGEINVKAVDDVTFGANATTAGNIVVQAGDAITQSAGTLTAAGIALEAGSTIGAAGNAIDTATSTLVMQSAGDQYVSNTGDVTLAATTTSNGAINVTNSGVLTVGTASVLTGIAVPDFTGGMTSVAPGLAVIAVTANGSGNVNLVATGTSGDIVTDATVSSGTGSIVLTAARDVTNAATGSVFTGGAGTIGVTAQTGSIAMVDGASYSTAGGNITASAANDIALAQASTGSNTAGTVTLTATGGAISTSRTAAANNVTAGTFHATATSGVGAGALDSATALTTDVAVLGTAVTGSGDVVIDNTGSALLTLGDATLGNSAANGSVRVATAGALATGNSVSASDTVQLVAGDINGTLTDDVGAVTLANNVTAGTLDINAGGLVQQTGGVITAATTLIDATRFTTGSDATLVNGTDAMTENGSTVIGNYTITTDGRVDQTGTTTVGGHMTESGYTGGTVAGTVIVAGNYDGVNTFSGTGSVTTGGSNSTTNANSATTGVVVATGLAPDFDLSTATLGSGQNITVNLRGQSATVTGNTPAILLNGTGGNSLGTVTVQTAAPVTVALTQQDYNLVQTAAIDVASLTVNSVAGTVTPAGLANDTLGTLNHGLDYGAHDNTLNAGAGSRIALLDAGNAIGALTINNADTAGVVISGNITLNNITLNNGLSVTSTGGAIANGSGTTIVARTLDLTAATGIGSAANPISYDTATVFAATGTVGVLATRVTGASGDTFVNTTGAVQLGGDIAGIDFTCDSNSSNVCNTMLATTGTAVTTTNSINSTMGGDITIIAAGPVTTGGTVSTAGDGNVDLANTSGSITLDHTVSAGGNGAVRLAAATNLAVNAQVSSTTGEINARAYDGDVALAADVSTAGNAFVQASVAITQSAGTLSADGAVLTAGTTIGSIANPVETSVNTLALVSAGEAAISNNQALTVAAQTSSNGSVGVSTTSGTLTVGSVALSPGITDNAVGASLADVAADGSGAVTLTATSVGSDIVLENAVTSASGLISATAARDIFFENAAQAATATTVVLTAGGDIANNTDNSVPQIRTMNTVLTAGNDIGSGIIDDGIAGTNNAAALRMDVAVLQANAGGDATMRNEGATVLGTSSAGGYFGLNGGGPITQAAGATLTAATVEFDTTRDTGIGRVDLQNSGDLNIVGANYAGGDYTATSQTGDVALIPGATLNVNGNVSLTSGSGGVVTLDPVSLASSGHVVQNGVTTHIDGGQLPLVVVNSLAKTAVVNAQGAGADFVLTPAIVDQLKAAGVREVTIDLGNTRTTYPVASLSGSAISVANANNAVSGGWTVRTGMPVLATPVKTVRNYNLTDTAGPVDLSIMNLVINAARGTDYTPGATPSIIAALDNSANAAAGFNAAQGSSIRLTQTSTGSLDVRDAYNVAVRSPVDLNVTYLHANQDAALLAGIDSGGDLNFNGPVNVGHDLIGVAGMDLNIGAGVNVNAGRRISLVADETAGTAIGSGWFVNRGRIRSASNEVAIYAVSGETPAGYRTVPNQVVLGDIFGFSGTIPLENWSTNYDTTANGSLYQPGTGQFAGMQVWYKRGLLQPLSVVRSVPQPMPVAGTAPQHLAEELIMSAGFTMEMGCGRGQHAGGRLGRDGRSEYDIGVPTYMNTATRQFGTVRGRRYEDGRNAGANDGCADVQLVPLKSPADHYTIGADALFAFDKSAFEDVLPGGRDALEKLGAYLKASYHKLSSITVTGHTDHLGADTYNQLLSQARAATIRDYLVAKGVSVDVIKVVGEGEANRVTKNCPEGQSKDAIQCLQPDRRVEIDVVGEKYEQADKNEGGIEIHPKSSSRDSGIDLVQR